MLVAFEILSPDKLAVSSAAHSENMPSIFVTDDISRPAMLTEASEVHL